ncbi:MAG: glycosyltransferase family 2 protein [Bacteroidota bacterium]
MYKVAILLPVFNNLEFTQKCIRLLDEEAVQVKFTNCSFHVVVVDDGSTDGTGAWLAKNYPGIHVCKGDGDLWWSGGVNLGANYAMEEMGADFLLLWNNDVTHSGDYFEQIDRLLAEPEDMTLYGSKIYFAGDQGLIWSYGGIFDPQKGKKLMLGFNQKDGIAFQDPVEVDWLPGMGTLIPVGALKIVGYWDAENFPQYHGDSDFTYRARKAGFHNMVLPHLILWNDKTNSGLTHGNSLQGLYKSLFSIRSNDNVKKNILFYRRHASSVRAYGYLLRYYFLMIGGFLKWKMLSLLGIKKTK